MLDRGHFNIIRKPIWPFNFINDKDFSKLSNIFPLLSIEISHKVIKLTKMLVLKFKELVTTTNKKMQKSNFLRLK